MGEEQPPKDAEDHSDGQGGAQSPAEDEEERAPPRRVPELREEDFENKRFAVGKVKEKAPLVVTVSDGPVGQTRMPLDVFGRFTDRLGALLQELGGGMASMFLEATPTGSMTIYIGDPVPEEAQTQLPVEVTKGSADRVARIIDLEGDDLFRAVIELGPPAANRYTEFAQLVESEGINVRWKPRDEAPRLLTPKRAEAHLQRLHVEPTFREHAVTVHGLLYRIIAEPHATAGKVGILLYSWSPRPPKQQGRKMLAEYEKAEVGDAIKAGLIGESVTGHVAIREPVLGTSIDLKDEIVLESIEPGAGEESVLGISLYELEDESSG